jgi:hypothetical protein
MLMKSTTVWKLGKNSVLSSEGIKVYGWRRGCKVKVIKLGKKCELCGKE